MKKGFVPIVLAAIIAGSVLLVGGGTTGYAYYHSNKLIESAKDKTANDKFVDANETYQKAAKWWPSRYRRELAKIAKENIAADKGYQEAVSAAEGGDYSSCISNLENINSAYPKYDYVTSVLNQCRDNKSRVAQGQAAVAMTIEDKSASSNTASSSNRSASSSNSSSQSSNQGSAAGNSDSPSTNSNSSTTTPAVPTAPAATSNGASPDVTPTIPTAPVDQTPTQTETIRGDFSESSIESIVNSLQLVYDDATGDFVTPEGGAPPSGVYHYDPIDVDNVYMGIRDGRIYIKLTVAGTFPNPQDVINGDKIKSLTFNVSLGLSGHTATDCGDGVAFQTIIEYHDDGTIWYGPHFWANCLSGTDEHNMVYEAYDSGIVHTYNSGLGKNTLVFSYALSDLVGTVEAGSSYDVGLYSEAESAAWHHYSFDSNTTAWHTAVTSLWTAAEI